MSDPAPRRRLRYSLRSLILLIVLISSATGLWYRWEPWVAEETLTSQASMLFWQQSPHPHAASFSTEQAALVEASGVDLSSFYNLLPEDSSSGSFLPDGRRAVTANYNDVALLWDLQTGQCLMKLRGHADIVVTGTTSVGPERTAAVTNDWIVTSDDRGQVRIWHRRRPEYWYGVAWLPEFWLTVALGGGLLWSLWRDRKISVAPAAEIA